MFKLSPYICLFFWHKYQVAQELTPTCRRLTCTRCTLSFAMNDDVRALVDWDSSFHRMYESFGIPIVYKDIEFKALKN